MNENNIIDGLITQYGKDIYSFCTYLTRSKQDSDDLYQDTFLKAIEKGEIDNSINPKSYLISIAINIWRNRKRKNMWHTQKVDIISIGDNINFDQVSDKSMSTEDLVIRKQEINDIRNKVLELPEKMRTVVLIYYMEDMKVDQISRLLKISTGTVKSRLYHARKIIGGNSYER